VEFVSAALTIVGVVAVLLWFGIIALAIPTVVCRLGRRSELNSRESKYAIASALGTTMVAGNRMTRLEDGARFYREMLAAIAGASIDCARVPQRSPRTDWQCVQVWEKGFAWTVWTLAGQRWAVRLCHRLRG
jgi:hypothetical protein